MGQAHQTDPWRVRESDFPERGTPREKLTFLVRYAILAPSSHDTQPRKFSIRDDEIRLFADKPRWLRVADADQRELHISLGCALVNLLVAAQHFGYAPRLMYSPDSTESDCIALILLPSPPKPAVDGRNCLRQQPGATHIIRSDARPVTESIQKRLKESCMDFEIIGEITPIDPCSRGYGT
jgi:hypothetical protein